MQQWLISLSTQHALWIYALIAFVAFAEGPFISILFGVLIKLGYFNIVPIFASLMAGDLFGDILWYSVGRRFGLRFVKRFGKYFSVTEESVAKIATLFHKYKNRILIASKVTNGLGFALVTILTAGMVRIPFGLFFLINFLGQFIWTGLLIAIGYFVGNLYSQVDSVLGYVSVTALIIILIAAVIGYRNYLKKKVELL